MSYVRKYEAWPYCPTCFKKQMTIHELRIYVNEYIDNETKKVNYLPLIDFRCNDTKDFETLFLSQYINFCLEESNKNIKENKNKMFCLQGHKWMNEKTYKVHESMIFNCYHLTSRNEINIFSFCESNEHKNKLFKRSNYFCKRCKIYLCNDCKGKHSSDCPKDELKHLKDMADKSLAEIIAQIDRYNQHKKDKQKKNDEEKFVTLEDEKNNNEVTSEQKAVNQEEKKVNESENCNEEQNEQNQEADLTKDNVKKEPELDQDKKDKRKNSALSNKQEKDQDEENDPNELIILFLLILIDAYKYTTDMHLPNFYLAYNLINIQLNKLSFDEYPCILDRNYKSLNFTISAQPKMNNEAIYQFIPLPNKGDDVFLVRFNQRPKICYVRKIESPQENLFFNDDEINSANKETLYFFNNMKIETNVEIIDYLEINQFIIIIYVKTRNAKPWKYILRQLKIDEYTDNFKSENIQKEELSIKKLSEELIENEKEKYKYKFNYDEIIMYKLCKIQYNKSFAIIGYHELHIYELSTTSVSGNSNQTVNKFVDKYPSISSKINVENPSFLISFTNMKEPFLQYFLKNVDKTYSDKENNQEDEIENINEEDYEANDENEISTSAKKQKKKNKEVVFDITESKPSDINELLLLGTKTGEMFLYIIHILTEKIYELKLTNNLKHDNSINDIMIIDKNSFATCSDDKKIKIFSPKETIELIGHEMEVTSMIMLSNQRELISSDKGGNLLIWDIKYESYICKYKFENKSILSLSKFKCVDGDNGLLIGHENGTLDYFRNVGDIKLELFNNNNQKHIKIKHELIEKMNEHNIYKEEGEGILGGLESEGGTFVNENEQEAEWEEEEFENDDEDIQYEKYEMICD